MQKQIAVVIAQPLAVTINTAAEMLECSRATIYTWIKKRGLPTVGVGADQRIVVSDLEAFVRDGKAANAARKLSPAAQPGGGRKRPKLRP